VQVAEQAGERRGTVQAPGPGLGEFAVDERQHLAPVLVQPRADQPRRGGEARLLEVTQQRVDGWRPRAGVAYHRTAPAVDHRPASTFETDHLTGRGHDPLSDPTSRRS
jgi:hypothetical protein